MRTRLFTRVPDVIVNGDISYGYFAASGVYHNWKATRSRKGLMPVCSDIKGSRPDIRSGEEKAVRPPYAGNASGYTDLWKKAGLDLIIPADVGRCHRSSKAQGSRRLRHHGPDTWPSGLWLP